MTIEQFKGKVQSYLETLEFKYEEPLFNIGDVVITKFDNNKSYISLVIGAKVVGTIISECSIPLVDFGKGRTFYISQEKLRRL